MSEAIESLRVQFKRFGKLSLANLFVGRRRGRLVRDYFVISVILISGGLINSGLLEIYFRYQESYKNLDVLQREVAAAAAFKAEHFINQIETAMRTATKSPVIARKGLAEEFQSELTRLLLVMPAIEEVAALDLTGRIRLQVSRFRVILPENKTALPPQAAFDAAKQGISFFGPVYFTRGSEPYNTITVPIERFAGDLIGILWAKVNLKYIWEIIQDIKVGKTGYAYIVTRSGDLVAHADLSLVLARKTWAHLDPIHAAFQTNSSTQKETGLNVKNLLGKRVFASHALIPKLDWAVIIEQPLAEAYGPLYASVLRTSSLLLIGLAMALFASVFVARRVLRPLEVLRWGAERIGAGDLNHKLEIKTGDEIETLAEEFNKMTARLQESYADLGRKVEERTHELSEALEQKSSIAEVLHVMAHSPNDIQPLLNAMIVNAVRLARAKRGVIYTNDGAALRATAYHNLSPEGMGIVNEPIKPDSQGAVSRAFISRKAVHIPDVQVEPAYSGPSLKTGTRTLLAVPMLGTEKPVGIIMMIRDHAEPFNRAEIDLVSTFADQAVIAIESVHLFQELEARTRDLARSVEELRALGEISQAINSILDLQTVLTTIVSYAVRLTDTDAGAVYELDDSNETLRLRAAYRLSDELIRKVQEIRIYLGHTVAGRVVVEREPVQVTDVLGEPGYFLREVFDRTGLRAILGVPLIREGKVVGVLIVGRKLPGPFETETVELLQSFATQSVLAIHNARLFRNIQEQRQQLEIVNERLREIDRLKSSFLSKVSHELRTPLTAIGGMAENLLDGIGGSLTEKQERYITGIRDSGERLARLIDDLLDLSAIEANRIKLTPTNFPLDDVVFEVAEMMKPLAETKAVTLEVPAGSGSLMARADRDKIAQVLTNLLINAVKFTPSPGRVAVRLHPTADGKWLQINIADNGPGIPTAEVEKIFDEFYQIRHSEGEKVWGVGLGLAICKRLVEMHGGAIWVESAEGRGSCFSFTVPALQTTSQQPLVD